MRRFHFPLERVLAWRRTELELAECRFKQQAAALAEIDRRWAQIQASGIHSEIQLRQWNPVSGGDLEALHRFRIHNKGVEEALSGERASCRKELAAREGIMLAARRRLRLMERLKDRKLSEWQNAAGREAEQQTTEAFLARWPAG